jgi:hypothetical protein
MIFGIFKTYRDIKKGTADPTGFGRGMLLGVVKAPLMLFTLIGLGALAICFIFGWTGLLFGPFGFFRFLFFIILIPFSIFGVIFWSIYSKLKKLTQRAKERMDEEINIISAEIEE